MARIVVIIPVVAVVDSGAASALSNDAAIAVASAWLALPSNAGMVVASKALEPKTYDAAQSTNAQLAGSGASVIKEPLA